MATNLLLDTHLKTLGLRAFRENYQKLAAEAAQANLDYERFLLALAEQEVALRAIFPHWGQGFHPRALWQPLLFSKRSVISLFQQTDSELSVVNFYSEMKRTSKETPPGLSE